jgi:hypothetical protein
MVLIVYLFVERVLTSPFGRLLKAMRENENVVRAFGKDILMLRIKTAAVGSGIAALAGALYPLTSFKREKCTVCKWFKRSEIRIKTYSVLKIKVQSLAFFFKSCLYFLSNFARSFFWGFCIIYTSPHNYPVSPC